MNNAAKPSGCESAAVEFAVDGRELRLAVADDGRGFDLSDPREGHGLESMQDRAEAIGGTLGIESKVGTGTTVRMRVPL